MPPHWPPNVAPASVAFFPDAPSKSGGQSLTGFEQIVQSTAGRWHAQLTMKVALKRYGGNLRDRVFAARAVLAYLQGRANVILIGPSDSFNAPSPVAGGAQGLIKGVTHSDGTTFSDGTTYARFATPALLNANVAAGDMAATIALLAPGLRVDAGQYFGFVPAGELYLINSVVDNGAGVYAVTFWPPARLAHVAGEDVNFDTPLCAMRLAKDDSAQLAFSPGFVADQQLELIEAAPGS
jgi:hypothetical protein